MKKDATPEAIEQAMKNAWKAFEEYRKYSLKQRAGFMQTIASEIEKIRAELKDISNKETNIPKERLDSEISRTIFQLDTYGEYCESGQWMDIRIDTSDEKRNPPKRDLRKMLVPLGPVVVFGAANFPFAYSTAGGDTACAFAAGCPVIVKAHPAHVETSTKVAEAIHKAVSLCNMPPGIFQHIYGAGSAVGEALVKHPFTKAVGFTGSLAGGKQLFDWGNQRTAPIPVFAEMSSVNPIFILPDILRENPSALADRIAASITLGVGQFCTNPGILVAIKCDGLKVFIKRLSENISTTEPASMLHSGIFKNYEEKRKAALLQTGVHELAQSTSPYHENQGTALIATVDASWYLQNQLLHQEVFGPFSILVQCNDENEMLEVARTLEGQLTTTIISDEKEIVQFPQLKDILKEKCGRFIWNGVPTGVEVCLAMQHGGPYPATTDSRFTSVGADGIKRFARPVTFQNWPDSLLPDELKESNPLKIWRTVDGVLIND